MRIGKEKNTRIINWSIFSFRTISTWCSSLCPRVFWQVIAHLLYFFPFIIWRERKYSKSDPNSQPWNLQHGLNLPPAHPFVPNCPKWGSLICTDRDGMSLWSQRWSMWRTCTEMRSADQISDGNQDQMTMWIVCFECTFSQKLKVECWSKGSWTRATVAPGWAPLHLLPGRGQGICADTCIFNCS